MRILLCQDCRIDVLCKRRRRIKMKGRKYTLLGLSLIAFLMLSTKLVMGESLSYDEEIVIQPKKSIPTIITSDGQSNILDDLESRMNSQIETVKSKTLRYENKTLDFEEDTPDTPMKETISYSAVYKGVALVLLAFLAGEASLMLGLPHYVGTIILGVLLGPQIGKVITQPDVVLSESGWVGIALLFFNVGVEWDHSKILMAGFSAGALSFLGALISFVTFLGLGKAYGLSIPFSAVLAATFVPTSISCLVRSFYHQRLLNTPFYQFLIGAVLVDDILGILIIPLLAVMSEENPPKIKYFYAILSSFGFFSLIYMLMLIKVPNLLIKKGLKAICSKNYVEISTICLAILTLIGMMPLLQVSKSHYLVGAFLAGLLFSNTPLSTYHYSSVGKYFIQFMTRVFFVATVGLTMPIQEIKKDPSLIGWGVLFFTGTFTKSILGFISIPISKQKKIPKNFPYNTTFVKSAAVAFVMCCRGELTIILSTFAFHSGIMPPRVYIAVILAIFLWVIPAPFLFEKASRKIISMSQEHMKDISPENVERQGDESTQLFLLIQIRSRAALDYHLKVRNVLQDLNLFVHDHRIWYPKDMNPIVVTEIYVTDTKTVLTVPANPDTDTPLARCYLESEIVIGRCQAIQEKIERRLHVSFPEFKIKVLQWVPGAYEEIRYNDEVADTAEAKKPMKPTTNDFIGGLIIEKSEKMTYENNVEGLSGDPENVYHEFFQERSEVSSSSSEFSYESFTRLRRQRIGTALANHKHTSLIQTLALHEPKILGQSLWFSDSISQEAAMTSSERMITYYDQTFGRGLGLNTAYMPYLRLDVEFKLPVENRLAGLVREIQNSPSS